jgi:hydrogenase nickel incorporation protein HypA/HybF
MHEMAITQQVLEIALHKAQEAGARTIIRINLVIGDLSGVMDDSVQFYFDFLSRDSMAQGAQLSFQRIPLQVLCHQCRCVFTPKEEPWECPTCREWKFEIIAGKEFYLDSIEVE